MCRIGPAKYVYIRPKFTNDMADVSTNWFNALGAGSE
jgi:hypothetical protein